MKKIFISLTCFLLLGLYTHSQPGTLDPSFGNNGHVISYSTTDYSLFLDIAIQNDGKILATGGTYHSDDGAGAFLLARYNKDGSPDNTFGIGGTATTYGSIMLGGGYAHSLAIQEDGKIIIGGAGFFYNDNNNDPRFTLARFNANGTLDLSFDEDGLVQTVFTSSGWSQIKCIKLQQDGKIVVGGEIRVQTNTVDGYEFALARYNMDGSLDHGFGQDGLIRGMFPNTVGNFIAEILLFDDGRILTVGAYQMFDDAGNYHPSAVIQRFNGNGSLDQSFGNGGFVTIENCWANAATIQMDGRILVAGIKVLNSGNYDFLVARYYEDGSLDTDFDEDGIAITDLGYANINCYGVGVQTDGKILLAGSVYDLNANIALVRYKPDGSLDENFGEYGKVFTDFGKRESIFAMAVDKERIYLSGWQDGFTTPALGQFGLLAAYQSGPICNNSFEVTIPDAYAINPGGNVNTVYVGYQPASSITLTASPSGGNAPDSYNWSTSPSQTTQQITVSPTTTSTYTCTVTDATGCAASSTKTITVVDIRTPGKPGKVNICHRDLKGKWTTLSVLAGSVAEHLTHGDYLGICNNNSSSNEVLTRAANETGNSEIISEEFKIYPNPATHFLDVQWAKTNNSQSTIRILNAEGRVVRTVTTEGAINNQRISLDGLAKGIYMLVLKTGSDQQVSKFVIQ